MFNDIENGMWDDEEFDDEKSIDYERDEKAVEFFSKKQKDKLRELIEELSEDYEEGEYLHILALYKILNNENAKEIIEKTLKSYEEDRLIFNRKIVIFLAYGLTKYYEDKKILEKLYTYILKKSYELTESFFSDFLNDIADCVLEAREWLVNHLDLNDKEKTIINFIALSVLENTTFWEVKDEEIEKIFRNYVLLLWELRGLIDVENAFAPLLKGIGWSYVNIKAKKDEDIINYFISLGVDERVAKELLKLYLKDDESNGDDIDVGDMPF
jgi:hypothetical protein